MKKCRQITALISQRADRPLTRSERLALRLHLMICPHCREYARQIELVQQAVKKFEPETAATNNGCAARAHADKQKAA